MACVIIILSLCPAFSEGHTPGGDPRQASTQTQISFKNEVFPLLQKYCLPCHAEESDNSSGLSLDSYKLMMQGGKHGSPVVAGDAEKSNLILKLRNDPPFGDPMPLARRRKSNIPPKRLTDEEVNIIIEWIKEGAKEN
jgi:hypothetical protein